jgi:hypothetical protein
MWLLLCEPNDVHALRASRGLRARGVEPLEVVSSEQLAYGLRWEHRLDRHGVRTEIALADGRTIRSSEVRGTVNRLQRVPDAHFARASEADRIYAHQELTALTLSFLHGLPGPMLNRPAGPSPSGPWLNPSEWTWQALQAGLQVAPYSFTSDEPSHRADDFAQATSGLPLETLTVAGQGVVGRRAPAETVAGCLRLGERTGASLLEVQFAIRDGDWVFAGATPYPELARGGDPLLGLMADALGVSSRP